MAHKIFLSPSNQDENTYAYGNTNESEQCGAIAELVKQKLEYNGFEVMLMHNENVYTKVNKANEWGAEHYIPIHSNGFNGQVSGTRMFYYSKGGEGEKMCKSIFDRLAPVTIGTSENYTQNTTFYELIHPNAWTCYIEIDFHDVPMVAKWIIEHHEEIATAICQGICDYYGQSYKAEETPSEQSSEPTEQTQAWTVQVGYYTVKSNAERMRDKLISDGYPTYMKAVKK